MHLQRSGPMHAAALLAASAASLSCCGCCLALPPSSLLTTLSESGSAAALARRAKNRTRATLVRTVDAASVTTTAATHRPADVLVASNGGRLPRRESFRRGRGRGRTRRARQQRQQRKLSDDGGDDDDEVDAEIEALTAELAKLDEEQAKLENDISNLDKLDEDLDEEIELDEEMEQEEKGADDGSGDEQDDDDDDDVDAEIEALTQELALLDQEQSKLETELNNLDSLDEKLEDAIESKKDEYQDTIDASQQKCTEGTDRVFHDGNDSGRRDELVKMYCCLPPYDRQLPQCMVPKKAAAKRAENHCNLLEQCLEAERLEGLRTKIKDAEAKCAHGTELAIHDGNDSGRRDELIRMYCCLPPYDRNLPACTVPKKREAHRAENHCDLLGQCLEAEKMRDEFFAPKADAKEKKEDDKKAAASEPEAAADASGGTTKDDDISAEIETLEGDLETLEKLDEEILDEGEGGDEPEETEEDEDDDDLQAQIDKLESELKQMEDLDEQILSQGEDEPEEEEQDDEDDEDDGDLQAQIDKLESEMQEMEKLDEQILSEIEKGDTKTEDQDGGAAGDDDIMAQIGRAEQKCKEGSRAVFEGGGDTLPERPDEEMIQMMCCLPPYGTKLPQCRKESEREARRAENHCDLIEMCLEADRLEEKMASDGDGDIDELEGELQQIEDEDEQLLSELGKDDAEIDQKGQETIQNAEALAAALKDARRECSEATHAVPEGFMLEGKDDEAIDAINEGCCFAPYDEASCTPAIPGPECDAYDKCQEVDRLARLFQEMIQLDIDTAKLKCDEGSRGSCSEVDQLEKILAEAESDGLTDTALVDSDIDVKEYHFLPHEGGREDGMEYSYKKKERFNMTEQFLGKHPAFHDYLAASDASRLSTTPLRWWMLWGGAIIGYFGFGLI